MAAPLFAEDPDSPPVFGGAAKSKPAAVAARTPALEPKRASLFADDPDSPTALASAATSKAETAAAAAPAAREAKPASLFAENDDDGSSPFVFGAATKSKPAPAAPAAAPAPAAAAKPSKSLFADSDEDDDGGALFKSRAPLPRAAPAAQTLRKPTSLFDDSESDEDAVATAAASRASLPATRAPTKGPALLDAAENAASPSPPANAKGALHDPVWRACSFKAPPSLTHPFCMACCTADDAAYETRHGMAGTGAAPQQAVPAAASPDGGLEAITAGKNVQAGGQPTKLLAAEAARASLFSDAPADEVSQVPL
jgi:hypothetical protein